ncbi:glucocorticoid-induced transcript 1 protein-like isoform X1 [Clupea harengus]|uniref:Glucocorticoid-induced transcript 1 protein-like isoform X1 n=1 Tax=Clupea harengus TaxID=7950 RepID=A0A6P8G761_CLUHA|nr:glucocorticoid-induced transcript 1 protein-like isoform X1 [Clupea harengus]
MSAASDTNCHFQQQRLRLGSAGSPSLPNNSSSRLQPIRAIVPYQLLRGGQQSPPRSSSVCAGSGNNAGATLCLSSSPPCQIQLLSSHGGNAAVDHRLPAMQRLSPESRSSPERPLNSTYRAERPVPQPVRSSTAIRRTSSLDTVTITVTGPYLTGQWPRDLHTPDPSWTRDKATQTSWLWGEDRGDLACVHQRSASWGSADHLREQIAKLRQQLKKQGVRPCREKEREKEREREREKEQGQGPSNAGSLAQTKAPAPSTALKSLACRAPSYTEGINHELENVFINDEWERDDLKLLEVQDGRRAPFPLHCHDSGTSSRGSRRSADAQAAPSCCSSPRCRHTPSPSPTGPLDSQTSSPWLLEDQDKDSGSGSPLPKYATSPKPNNSFMFKREPPEGCEKVKVFEETISSGFPLFSCPDKNKVNFIPTGSAFCPVKMPCSALRSSRLGAVGPHTADHVSGSTSSSSSSSGDRALPSGPGTR